MPNALRDSYDVVIVGGAMYGSSVAWWLTEHPDFDGSILVIERDPTYEWCSTTHTNSCIRQQFSNPLNVQISQFGAEFIKNFRTFMGGENRVPQPVLQSYGYLYLAGTPARAAELLAAQQLQASLGAGTRHLDRAALAAAYPFYNLDDVVAANHNPIDEGYFDGNTIFDWWKRLARERGAVYLHDEVTAINRSGDRITGVTLASGESVGCGTLVNCTGPRAALSAGMAGIDLPIEPRKRYTFIFEAAEPLDRDLPLTIDPSGVHMRSEGQYYLAGCPPDDDPAVDPADFQADHSLWEEKVWPAIAHRVPAFERIRLRQSWVGHYAYNTFDQNAVIGPHPEVTNFIMANGFSGHGLQQSPALGRGLAEWIATGSYQTLDLRPLHYDRLIAGEPYVEKAVI